MAPPTRGSEGTEPLGLFVREVAPPAPWPELRALRLEFSSRGDRVPARLLRGPRAAEPTPVILLAHGAAGAKDAAYMDAAAGPWARGGAAVLSIDFPLHGERASPKWSARVLAALAEFGNAAPSATAAALLEEFVGQALADLRRSLDALGALPQLDASRVAYAGFSLGSLLGALFCASEPRLRAAALALGGGGFGPPQLDPARHIGGFAPRPLLFVNAERDVRIPRAAAESLHRAAGEPKQVLWFDAGHSDLPGRALKAMWSFLRRQLALEDDGAGG